MLREHRRHPERRCFRGDGAADASGADDAKLLATQLGSEHEIQSPALPSTGADQPVALPNPPCNAQDQRPREFRDSLGQHIRGIGDDDTSGARCRYIDIVVSDGYVCDDLQISRRIQHSGVDFFREQADEGIFALDTAQQLLSRNRPVARVQIDRMLFGEQRQNR